LCRLEPVSLAVLSGIILALRDDNTKSFPAMDR
jgi:hypothetical protein